MVLAVCFWLLIIDKIKSDTSFKKKDYDYLIST